MIHQGYKASYLFLLWLLAGGLIAQSSVINPSFEEDPQDATVPQGWMKCAKGTTPDILPGPWGVYTPAFHGNTYVGLITRSDGSYESIGQRLSIPLEKDRCYTVSLQVAHSSSYAGFNGRIHLRVWLGSSLCQAKQLILETDRAISEQWTPYAVQFTAEKDYQYIILEAYRGDQERIRGNILIDMLSPIVACDRT